jgi:hypothetical protein
MGIFVAVARLVPATNAKPTVAVTTIARIIRVMDFFIV